MANTAPQGRSAGVVAPAGRAAPGPVSKVKAAAVWPGTAAAAAVDSEAAAAAAAPKGCPPVAAEEPGPLGMKRRSSPTRPSPPRPPSTTLPPSLLPAKVQRSSSTTNAQAPSTSAWSNAYRRIDRQVLATAGALGRPARG